MVADFAISRSRDVNKWRTTQTNIAVEVNDFAFIILICRKPPSYNMAANAVFLNLC